MAKTKICSQCNIEKELILYRLRKDTWKYRNKCNDCLSIFWKDYKLKNQNRIKDKNYKYKKSHIWRLSYIAYNSKRRALIKTTSDWTITKEALDLLFNNQWWKCNYCNNTKNLHLDHIKPISKWWPHSINNVQWLCQSCNLTKWNKYDN